MYLDNLENQDAIEDIREFFDPCFLGPLPRWAFSKKDQNFVGADHYILEAWLWQDRLSVGSGKCPVKQFRSVVTCFEVPGDFV